MTDLWPETLGQLTQTPPNTILREQGQILANKTKGLLEGVVSTSKSGTGFLHQFFLVAPLLDNYTYRLLLVQHDLGLYPAEATFEGDGQTTKCNSAEEFQRFLRSVFSSPKTMEIVSVLLAQMQEVSPTPQS